MSPSDLAEVVDQPGGLGGDALLRLLADERARTIVRALADGPLRPSQLDRLPGLARSTLYVRLGELTLLGVLEAHKLTEFPLRIEYRLTDRGRVAIANELLLERQRLHRMTPTGVAGTELEQLVHFLAPVSHIGRGRLGVCVLQEHGLGAEPPELRLLVRDRCVSLDCEPPTAATDARVTATTQIWDRTLLAGGTRGLEIEGDRAFACAVLGSLRMALTS